MLNYVTYIPFGFCRVTEQYFFIHSITSKKCKNNGEKCPAYDKTKNKITYLFVWRGRVCDLSNCTAHT